jgi:signal transduction histidine kinase/CheY-like chemotaxis protein
MAAPQVTAIPAHTDPRGPGFDAIPSPMALLDQDLTILSANRAFAELLQAHEASLIGEPLGHRLRAAASDTPTGDGIQTFGFQFPDGPRWLRLDLLPFGDGHLAVLVDVTGERAVLERMKADLAARGRLMHDGEIGVWRYDPEAQVYHFPSELALGHANIAEPVPLDVLRLIQHPDDQAIDNEIRERLTREEGAAESEMRYRTSEGGWTHLRVLYRSGRKLKSGRYEMYGLSQNVTALAEARDEANISSQRLKLALTAAKAGVFAFDYATDSYWISQEAKDLVGDAALAAMQSADDAMAIFHSDDLEAMRFMGEASRQAGQAISRDGRILRDNGSLWVRIYWQTECDAVGEPVRGIGLILDIDAQKRQELALAEARDEATASAQRLNLALTAASAGVCGFDYHTREFWASQEFHDLMGPTAMAATLAASDPRVAFHPDDQERLDDLTGQSAKAGGAIAIEARLLREGEPLWMRVYWLTKSDADGVPISGVGLLIDIDAQKRQELALTEARTLAESATASKSSFLASVSHEIRTPMNGIVGVLNLLKREVLSGEGRDLLGEALACSDMLSQLIDDVLDFSKMEAGKLEVTPVPTDPVAVMGSVVALLHPQADNKNLYLRAVTPEPVGWLNIDPVRLRQCLFNVIGNAVKFTESGGVEVRMLRVGDPANPRLRCEVEDTGVGVPESAKNALFDRFQQAHSGPSRKFGGTGLGLAISRSLSRMMGGDMGFESAEGVGSMFWFEISAPPAEAQDEMAIAATAEREPLSGLRILIVDDNRTNRLVGLKTLEALGAYAETADSGEAAIAAAVSGGYDLILMDVNMPGMDGMEATRRIRALPGRESSVPIVALTADVMTHHQQAYRDAGMNGFVPKPFAPAQLLTEIARLSA